MVKRKFHSLKGASNHVRGLQRQLRSVKRFQQKFGQASLLSRRDEGKLLGNVDVEDGARPAKTTPLAKVLLSSALVRGAFAQSVAEGSKATGFTNRTVGVLHLGVQ